MTEAEDWIRNFRLLCAVQRRKRQRNVNSKLSLVNVLKNANRPSRFCWRRSSILSAASEKSNNFSNCPQSLERFIKLSSNIWSLEKSFGKFCRQGNRKFLLPKFTQLNGTNWSVKGTFNQAFNSMAGNFSPAESEVLPFFVGPNLMRCINFNYLLFFRRKRFCARATLPRTGLLKNGLV